MDKLLSPLWGAMLVGVVVSVLAVSCEMSSGLLTESERSSLYALTVTSDQGSSLTDGAVLAPGASLGMSVVRRSGASALSALDVSLLALDGTSVASVRFLAGTADAAKLKSVATTSLKKVTRVEGELGGLSIPAGQAFGPYRLRVSAIGSDGGILQESTISVFVGDEAPVIDSVSVYPPSIEPGASALLSLSASWKTLVSGGVASTGGVARDPWIRWSRNGSSFAAGFLSAGLGKAVWTAPRSEGAYSVRVEVFPFAPSANGDFTFKAAATQNIRVMVMNPAGGSGDDFGDPSAFYSLLRLDGSLADSGTRARSAQPEVSGTPSLEAYPGGFGYRFGPSAGVKVTGLMPPGSAGKLGPFAVLVRVSPDQGASGSLVRFASADSSYGLNIGLDGGRPYVETRDGGAPRRSTAAAPVPRGAFTLEAALRPEGGSLSVSWRAEGERIDSPSIPLPSAPPPGSAFLGGAEALQGVYDGFGMMVPGAYASYPSPAFRLASRRAWKGDLILAEGFEDGVLPQSAVVSGQVSLGPRGLTLGDAAALRLSPSFVLGPGFAFEAGIEGDPSSLAVDFLGDSGAPAFSVRGSGEVLDPAGRSLAVLPASGGNLSFSVEAREGSLRFVGRDGKSVCAVPGGKARYAISLARRGGVGTPVVYRVLARSAATAAAGR